MWFFRFAIILLELICIEIYSCLKADIVLRTISNINVSPKEKAEYDMKTKIGVAEALSKLELPRVVMAGGNTNSGGTAMDAMGLKMVSDLVDKMSN